MSKQTRMQTSPDSGQHMQIRSNKCHQISSKYPFFISLSNNMPHSNCRGNVLSQKLHFRRFECRIGKTLQFLTKKKQCFWTLPILSVPQRSSGSEGSEGWFPTWHWGEWLEGCWIHYHAPQYRHYIIEIILRDTKGIKGSKTSYNESSTECFVDPDWLHVTSMYIYIY